MGRVEIKWNQDESWLNLIPMDSYDPEEWQLIVGLLAVGSRKVGVEFEIVDMVTK